MRPSVRAEKYIRDASGWRKDVTHGNDNGTDGQTECDAICGLYKGRIITSNKYVWPYSIWIYGPHCPSVQKSLFALIEEKYSSEKIFLEPDCVVATAWNTEMMGTKWRRISPWLTPEIFLIVSLSLLSFSMMRQKLIKQTRVWVSWKMKVDRDGVWHVFGK